MNDDQRYRRCRRAKKATVTWGVFSFGVAVSITALQPPLHAQAQAPQTETSTPNVTKFFEARLEQSVGGASNAIESASGRDSVFEGTVGEFEYTLGDENVQLSGDFLVERTRFFQSKEADNRALEFRQAVSFEHQKNWRSRVELTGNISESFVSQRETADSGSLLTSDSLIDQEYQLSYSTTYEVNNLENRLEVSGREITFNNIDMPPIDPLIPGSDPSDTLLIRNDEDRTSGAVFVTSRYTKFEKVQPFVTGLVKVRSYQDSLDENGNDRDSRTFEGTVGVTFIASPTVSGELRVGYLEEQFEDELLPTLRVPTVDGRLSWRATVKTNVTANISTGTSRSSSPDESGSANYSASVRITHDLTDKANISLGANTRQSFFTALDDGIGLPQTVERRYGLNVGADYTINDNADVFARGSVTTFESTFEELDYEDVRGSIGLRLKL